jgi:hypothetical protein
VWFRRRGAGIWAVAEDLMTVLQLLPLFLLFLPPIRRSPRWLVMLSLAILAGRLLEYAWLTIPELPAHHLPAILVYLLSCLGLIQISLAVLARSDVILTRLGSGRPLEVPQ